MPNDYAAKIAEARKQGYSDDEIAQFIGKSDTKMAEALKQGYSGSEILGHLETATQQEPSKPGATERLVKSYGAAVGAPERWQDVLKGPAYVVRHPIESAKLVGGAALESHRQAAQTGLERMKQPGLMNKLIGAGQYVESGIPLLGPAFVGAGQQAESGDVAGAIGTTAGIGTSLLLADPEGAAGLMRKAPGAIREGVAVAGRTPANTLRPSVRVGSRIAGAYIGKEAMGTEGAVVGGLSGPAIAESIIPKRTVAEQLRAPASETVRAPASIIGAAPSEVLIADVPRPPQPNVPPGSMFSVPRENLPGLIQSRQAGASEAFQASGGKMLFRGEPEGYPARQGKIGMETIIPDTPANAATARTQSGVMNRLVEGTKDVGYGLTHPGSPEYARSFGSSARRISGSPGGDIAARLTKADITLEPQVKMEPALLEEVGMIVDELPKDKSGRVSMRARRLIEPLVKSKLSPSELFDVITSVREKLGLGVKGK